MAIEHWPEADVFIDEVLKEKDHGSDRALVLVGVTMVDNLLQRLLHMNMIEGADEKELFSGDGAPLGAFSKKIKVAFSLGLLTKTERECCDTLRKIRNSMAHELGATLSSTATRSQAVSIYEKSYKKKPNPTDDERTVFFMACTVMIVALLARLKKAKHADEPTTGLGI
ncbi:hypothetical protein [Brucella sp. 22210]|uniref:hypothetical protein n=1 Tax=Brucella sp. 22210 TaxID=3453892 RepID=UPI003F86D0EC